MTTTDDTLQELKLAIRGPVIAEGDPEYEALRGVWNAMIDRRPAYIARCTGAVDVINAVNFARTHRLPLAVRGGAHGIAGMATCDEGLVIDCSLMKGIRVDPANRTARAEPGLRWSEFDRETQAFGLATTGGTVGDTGIAGLTLGGGFGWLGGKHGMTVDNLLSVDIVLADGSFTKASATENADLFWAVRGGSGNFGVVTSFEYQLHPCGPMIAGGAVFHPFHAAKDVLRFYREFIKSKPDELSVYAGLLTGPDGHKMAAMVAAYIGDMQEGMQAIAPLKAFGSPAMDMLGPIPYTVQQSLFEAGMPPGLRNYWKADFISDITDGVIDVAVDAYERAPSPQSVVLWAPIDGEAARKAVDSTAYPHRGGIHMGMYALYSDAAEDEANIAWVRQLWHAVQPAAAGGVYVNELGADDGQDRVGLAYGVNHARLAQIKAKYDPGNLFRLNANILPAR